MAQRKVRVLIVDDSSVVRTLLARLLGSDPDIEVVGQAPDPYVAREKLVALKPDVMTLDIEMPRMDGLTFLEKVMTHMPTPTLVLSSLSRKGSELALRATELGAVEVLAKPALDVREGLEQLGAQLRAKVKAAAGANLSALKAQRGEHAAPLVRSPAAGGSLVRTTHQVLAIAASTGGTEALKFLLSRMDADIPGTLVVQHMPPVFTKTFSASLNALCPFEVREAADGDRLHPGLVLIAPGNFHMELARSGAVYHVRLNQNPPEHSVRPAADPLFRSVARVAGRNAVGVVLTGMGHDGAQGLLAMKQAGAKTFAQDKASCVVYGMPREAVECGAVCEVASLTRLPGLLCAEFRSREVA